MGLMRTRTITVGIATVAVAAAATAVWLFPRALPILALDQNLTRDVALARADSFFRAHALAPVGARTAVRFRGSDSLNTFVELAGGGHDSINALVRGRDVAVFVWSVRAFVPGDPHEARVDFAPDGRIVGFARTLAEADTRPEVSADSGQRLAEQVLASWINYRSDRWKLVTSSYETKKTSRRVDRTYTFERMDRRVGGAPIRADVVIAGDTPSKTTMYVEIPETFRRRYGEMRSFNELLSGIDGVGIIAIVIAGIVALIRSARDRRVRWRGAMVVGGVVGVFAFAAGLNEMPGSWFTYDTATSPATYQAMIALGATAAGLLTAVLVGFTLAAAESATRAAYPHHLDWWKLWTYRGTTAVATRVAGGYAASTIAFAYVAIFYLATRSLLGWWVPSELLADPNQIATPLPWISGIAASLQAGVWEEALFRALPLSLLSLWVGQRPKRQWWMAGGVIVSALIFGFAHSNYDSWPPYSRGVEIFLDACFWGVLFISFGLIVTVVAHFVYDLVLFGLFAATGSAVEYRISAAIIVLALLSPALAVAWKWFRQRGLTTAPDEARFAAWTPEAQTERVVPPEPVHAHTITPRARQLAVAAALLGAVVAVARPPKPTLGPQFTAERPRVVAVTDSVLRHRGVDPTGWKRLTNAAYDTLASWPRFVRQHKLVPRAQELAASYLPAAWWAVRYVHTAGTAAQRNEEWRVRLWPDGRPLDARHLIADSSRRNPAEPPAVRRIALASLTHEGVNAATLQETEFKETARAARRDVTVTYTDTAVKLPDGAVARTWVQVAGDEPLVTRRGVDLPEKFLRADREQQTNRALVAGLCVLLLVGGFIVGAIIVVRRREILVQDGVFDKKRTLGVVAALAALAGLERLNSLPSVLFSYDTSEPWGNFISSTAVGFLTVIIGALFVFGVWLALNAVRRRVGIPMLAGAPSRATSNDMLLVGLGLGSICFALARYASLLPSRGMPRPPSTLLTLEIPLLGGLTNIPADAMMAVAAIAIPILVVVGITRRWALRALIAAAVVGLLIGTVASLSPPTNNDLDAGRIVAGLVLLAAASFAIYSWGSLNAWSWIVAALVYLGLDALRNAVYSPTWQAHGAGALGVVVVMVLIAAIARRTRAPVPAATSS